MKVAYGEGVMPLVLGAHARDTISGFTGTLTARCEHFGGLIEWKITALVGDDMTVKSEWFHEPQIEVGFETPRAGIA